MCFIKLNILFARKLCFTRIAADNCNLLHSFLHSLYFVTRFSMLRWKEQLAKIWRV